MKCRCFNVWLCTSRKRSSLFSYCLNRIFEAVVLIICSSSLLSFRSLWFLRIEKQIEHLLKAILCLKCRSFFDCWILDTCSIYFQMQQLMHINERGSCACSIDARWVAALLHSSFWGFLAWYILNTCNTYFHFGRGCNIPSIPVETEGIWQLQISVDLTGVSSERDSLGLVPNLGKVVTH